jgi:hypothetical protein
MATAICAACNRGGSANVEADAAAPSCVIRGGVSASGGDDGLDAPRGAVGMSEVAGSDVDVAEEVIGAEVEAVDRGRSTSIEPVGGVTVGISASPSIPAPVWR